MAVDAFTSACRLLTRRSIICDLVQADAAWRGLHRHRRHTVQPVTHPIEDDPAKGAATPGRLIPGSSAPIDIHRRRAAARVGAQPTTERCPSDRASRGGVSKQGPSLPAAMKDDGARQAAFAALQPRCAALMPLRAQPKPLAAALTALKGAADYTILESEFESVEMAGHDHGAVVQLKVEAKGQTALCMQTRGFAALFLLA